jgi:antirestriction protein ArdC
MEGGFGSEKYAREELVAELSSCIIGANLGLPVTHLDNHASYIASWIKLLKDDEKALLSAAAKAETAAAYLLNTNEQVGADTEDEDSEEPLAIAA